MNGKRTQKDLERLGTDLSQACEWNGLEILQASISALTDANFHRESEILEQMLNALSNSDNDLRYVLTVSEAQS